MPHFSTTLFLFSLQATLFSHSSSSSSSSNKTSLRLLTERRFYPSKQKYENDCFQDIDYAAKICQVFKNRRQFFAHDLNDFNWFRPSIHNPDLFLSVLDSICDKPRTVLWFFRWAEHQPGFDWSEPSFCAVLEILAENDLMRPAFSVAEWAVSLNLLGVVDVLMDECISPDVLVKLLDLVLWIYTKKSMVELALSTFYKMGRNGFLPDVNNCNRVFRVLRDGDLLVKAREVYSAMAGFGICPTIVTFNTMLDSYRKEGNVQEALDLLSEMQKKGCVPNDVTYNVLINGLSKKGEVDKAQELIKEMMNSGLKVSAYTYNPLIYGHCNCKKGGIVEAMGFGDEMERNGAKLIVSSFNL